MKAYTAMLATETNTFAPFVTTLEDYSIETEGNGGFREYLKTFEDAAANRDWLVIKGMAAFANPGGKTTTVAYSHLKNKLLDELKSALPVDAVVLALHGAMVSEDCDDCEGDILQSVRKLVGPDIPVGAGLDPHAHLTKKMTDNADILCFMKQWPHIDALDVATWAFDLTVDYAEGIINNPQMAVYDCKMIGYYHTFESPVKELVDETISLEGKEGVLSISIIHGFEPADVPDMGTKILVITDNCEEKGLALATFLGKKLYAMRGNTAPEYLDLQTGLDRVEQSTELPVLVADTSDVTGGGDPGDATFILEEMLNRKMKGGLITSLADPQAVTRAFNADIGSKIDLKIGGKTCKASGNELDIEAEILGIFPAKSVQLDNEETNHDDIVVIRAEGIEIVLRSSRETFMDYQPLQKLGIDLTTKKVIVVKSANNFYSGHKEIAGSFLYFITPGAFDPLTADYKYINKNIWPFTADPFKSDPYFSTQYAEARDKFLNAANALDAEIKSFKNPETGPDGEALYVDSCWIGPRDAEKVLLLISGTHGVEGFAGSACQLAWMDELIHHPLPNGVAALVVHMINPYGCAWLCVETEENIDLNRNFVDYKKPLPTNNYYEQLHSALSCSEYEGELQKEAELKIQQFIEANGYGAFLEAAAKGQYQHADGFNFGGQQPAWSNKILATLFQEALSRAKKVAVIDYHTGLGEYGDAILISDYPPDSETANRQQSWYGNIHFSQAGDIDYETTGGLAASIGNSISQAEVTPIVLEFGTYEIERIASAMLDSFWLTQFGDYSTDLAKQIQDEIKQCFYPNEADWNNKILQGSNKVITQAITGLETNY